MKRPGIPVSDHAVLRWLERAQGIEVEIARREIGWKVQRAIEHPDATAVIVDGFRFCLRGGVVTTVLLASRPDLRTGRVRPERPE